MKRNWGIPSKSGGFKKAHDAKPIATLTVTAAFGILGASLAALSFGEARAVLEGLFKGPSLIAAVFAAGFGCWLYIWMAWPRFAAQFTGGDAFSDLLRFYIKAAICLIGTFFIGKFMPLISGPTSTGLILCFVGGAAAAAAFQTVLTFVPGGIEDEA